MTRKDETRAALVADRTEALSIRQLRWSRGLSLEYCARAIGVSLREFLAKERGRSGFSAREVADLASLFWMDVDELQRALALHSGDAQHRSVEREAAASQFAAS
jgi:transcriptional regulator with XRE-family HTH domain